MQKDFSDSLESKPYLLGQVIDTSISQIDSYIAEDDIKFGQLVQLGTDPYKQVKTLPAGDLTGAIGIAVRTNMQPFGSQLAEDDGGDSNIITTTAEDTYTKGSMVSVMRLGRAALMVDSLSGAQTAGVIDLWYDEDTKTNIASSATVSDAIKIGRLMEQPVAGKIAQVQINKMSVI